MESAEGAAIETSTAGAQSAIEEETARRRS